MKEKTLKRQRIFKGKLLGLRVDTVKLPSGRTATREVVEHPGAVAVLAITKDKKLVLVKQYRQAVAKILLEVPAGVPKKGESILRTARRELEEETGYRADKLTKMLEGYVSPGYSTELMNYVLAKNLRKFKQATEEDENIEIVEIPLSKCWELVEKGKIRDNKTIIGILLLWKKKSKIF